MSKPIQPLPPRIGPDGKDVTPFHIVQGRSRIPYGHWFDAVLARESLRPSGFFVRIEGFEPSHDATILEGDSGLLSCVTCGVLQDTQGAVVPCGMDLAGASLIETARAARMSAEAGL